MAKAVACMECRKMAEPYAKIGQRNRANQDDKRSGFVCSKACLETTSNNRTWENRQMEICE